MFNRLHLNMMIRPKILKSLSIFGRGKQVRNEERLFLHRLVRFQEMASPSRVKQFMEDQGLVRAIAFNIRLPRGKTHFVFSVLSVPLIQFKSYGILCHFEECLACCW